MRTIITHPETTDLLVKAFPAWKNGLPKANHCSLHNTLRTFAGFTQERIDGADFAAVGDAFALAERWLTQENAALRIAVENSFLYALHLDWADARNKTARQMLPPALKGAYYGLVNPFVAF